MDGSACMLTLWRCPTHPRPLSGLLCAYAAMVLFWGISLFCLHTLLRFYITRTLPISGIPPASRIILHSPKIMLAHLASYDTVVSR